MMMMKKMTGVPSSLFVASFLLLVGACYTSTFAVVKASTVTTIIRSFEEWQGHHSKVYATSVELEQRRSIWLANQQHVEEHNRAYELGYTLYAKTMQGPFADLTGDEFREQYLMTSSSASSSSQDCSATTHTSSGRLRPLLEEKKKDEEEDCGEDCSCCHPAVDWRTKGIMTPVKKQGHCGSCWTFSTSGCLEAHICLAADHDCTHWTGLAEEQLVECAGDYNNHGCAGGLPSQAFEYLKHNGGMATEDDYPYNAPKTNGTGACHVPSTGYKAQVAEVYNITTRDEDDLVHAIATIGPVSVAYQVSPDFRLYAHGIYDSYNHTTNTTMCHDGSHDVNHAVVAVGLGTSKKRNKNGTDVDYYIIRNSWSADWGMEGHFWMKRGENLCGISDCASFPIVPAVVDDNSYEGLFHHVDKTTTTTAVSAALRRRRGRKN